jgi:thymidylate kinase
MGLLVNFEAIDSAGKKEQAALLVQALRARGFRVGHLILPDRPGFGVAPANATQRATGALITAFFHGQLKLIAENDTLFRSTLLAEFNKEEQVAIASIIEEKLLQVLQSVNRREAVFRPGGLADMLESCEVVVVERMLSAWAYGVAMGVSRVEINALEGDLPKPDLSILLDVDSVGQRANSRSSYLEKKPEFRRLYGELIKEDAAEAEREDRFARWLKLDASLPEEELGAQILAAVLMLKAPQELAAELARTNGLANAAEG